MKEDKEEEKRQKRWTAKVLVMVVAAALVRYIPIRMMAL